MNKMIWILCIYWQIPLLLFSQDDSLKGWFAYKTTVFLQESKNANALQFERPVDNIKKIRGYLHEVRDSSLVYESVYPPTKESLINIPFQNIRNIRALNRNNPVTGAVIGLGIGLLIGGLTGLSEEEDRNDFFQRSAKDKAIEDIIVFGLLGTITGSIIGSIKFEIPIDGKWELFNQQRDELLRLTEKK